MPPIASLRLSRRDAARALAVLPLTASFAAGSATTPSSRRQLTIVLTGGMSSQETFDPKPTAPVQHRSPAGSIPTGIPGVHFSAWLPRLAARTQDFTLFRAVTLGDLPATHAAGMSLLPSATVQSPSTSATNSRAYGASRFASLCRTALDRLAAGSATESVHFAETVFDTLSWDMHANGAGLPVSLADYRDTLCPQLDRVLCALLDDLKQRDLWEQTDLRVVTELGRAATFNARGGRDHAPAPFCALFAGARFATGQVLGETSSDGGDILVGATPLASLLTL